MRAWRSKKGRDPKTGSWPIVFRRSEGFQDMPVELPCGQCVGCRLDKSRQWAARCVLESQLYKKNCFVTLTYNEANVPENQTLIKKDWQLFIKRVRKEFGVGIRYYMCGEYGEVCKICGLNKTQCKCEKYIPGLGRPHYHACLFNFDFEDKYPYKIVRLLSQQSMLIPGSLARLESSGLAGGGGVAPPCVFLYRSNKLEELWKKGYCTIGEVNFESAAYVARYCTKKFTHEDKEMVDSHYGERLPEYADMSRKPGIAMEWFKKYYNDISAVDQIILRYDKKIKTPKYYDEYMKKLDPKKLKEVKGCRKSKVNLEEQDWKRLRTKEKLKQIQFKKLKRSLENG